MLLRLAECRGSGTTYEDVHSLIVIIIIIIIHSLYYIYTVFQKKKTSTHIIGYKLRNSCLILIIFDIKIPHII